MSKKQEKQVDVSLRQFIKDLGYVTGGAALLSTVPWLQSFTPGKLEEIKSEKARIALIGTGSRGQYHIHSLLPMQHVEIVALCDNYAPNLKAASELVPNAKTYTDYRKLLESADIDGVVISTPLNWHAPIVLDSMAAGKHVFCEKSMALTMDQCKAIYDAYQTSDRVLYFCMQRMFDEKYIKGMQMIHSGLIGDVVGWCQMSLVPQSRLAPCCAIARIGEEYQLAFVSRLVGRSNDRARISPTRGVQYGYRSCSFVCCWYGRYSTLERWSRGL